MKKKIEISAKKMIKIATVGDILKIKHSHTYRPSLYLFELYMPVI